MNISTILKSLDISKLSAITTLIFGGWADLAVLVCKAFTNLLRKADQTKLKLYAEFSAKVAKAIRFIVDLFISRSVHQRRERQGCCNLYLRCS